MALYMPDSGIERVFANGADVTVAGNGVPRGFARKVAGGYEIWGNWAFGSGICHAEWIHTGGFLGTPPVKAALRAEGECRKS